MRQIQCLCSRRHGLCSKCSAFVANAMPRLLFQPPEPRPPEPQPLELQLPEPQPPEPQFELLQPPLLSPPPSPPLSFWKGLLQGFSSLPSCHHPRRRHCLPYPSSQEESSRTTRKILGPLRNVDLQRTTASTSNLFGSLGIVVLFCLPAAFSKGATRVEFSFATRGQFYRTVAFVMHQQSARTTTPLVVWVTIHELKTTRGMVMEVLGVLVHARLDHLARIFGSSLDYS